MCYRHIQKHQSEEGVVTNMFWQLLLGRVEIPGDAGPLILVVLDIQTACPRQVY